MAKVRVTMSELKAKIDEKRIWAVERKARHQARGSIAGVELIERAEAAWDKLEQMLADLNAGKIVNKHELLLAASYVVTCDDYLDIEIINA